MSSTRPVVVSEIPAYDVPVADISGRVTEPWRFYFENISTGLFFNGTDVVGDNNFDPTLYYTQTEVNSLLSTKANTSHTHAASDVTSGTFANARISEASVTQHQAALSIAVSQLTGVPTEFTPSAHTHVIDDVIGLQTALDDKTDESAFGTPTASASLVSTDYIDLTLPNGDVFRLHGELNP